MKPKARIYLAKLFFLPLVLLCFGAGAGMAAQTTDPSVVGQWSLGPNLPFFPVHTHTLPTGKVMVWPGDAGISGNNPWQWDPATGSMTQLALPGYDLFCSGHSFLADGRLFVAGGHIANGLGLPNASIYNPFNNTWTQLPNMNAGRWYPTTTTLANGDVLVVSGSIDTNFTENQLPQVFQWATSTWRDLTNAVLALALYPRTHLAPNGKVFVSGMSNVSRYLDTSGNGSWTPVANSNVYRDYGSSVMYDNGKVLIMGGGDPPVNTAEVIDLNATSPLWRFVAPMTFARRQLNATVLPDGKVLVTGGTSGAGFNNPTGAVFAAEMWNPPTETWTTMASATIPRLYHSNVVLLPDGRLLSTGGNGYPQTEIYEPPYLFKGARPTITTAPSSVAYGQTFFVQTPDNASITQATWIRLSSTTHAFNMDQRFSRLSFSQTTNGLNVVAPSSANLSPPGYYMLFILNGNGVPSVAKVIQIQTAGTNPFPIATSLSPSSATAGGAAFTLTVNGSDFVSGSVVRWNGANRTTTFVNSTQLTAAIPASDITTVGTAQVTVFNAAPGGGISNALTFTISSATGAVGLVAAYSFNAGSGTTLTDFSGSNNHGTISGATWSTTGKYGGALVFNGTNALVTIPNSPSLQLTTGMTLQAWVNPSVVNSNWRDVIYKGIDNYYLEGTSSNGPPVVGGIIGGANPNLYGTANLAVNNWTHLAATYDGVMLRLYVNGSQVTSQSATGSIATSTNPLQIGGDSIFGQFFQGMIDEVRVYNRALSQAEIQSDLNTPVGTATNTAPTITTITAQTTSEDTATSAIAFTVGDVETADGSLTVSGSSSNTTLVPNANIVFGGSGANRTVTVTPALNQFGTATITVTVSDGQLSTPTSFLLTVNAVNDPPTITTIANQNTTTGTAVGPLSFTVGDVETAAGSLTVSGSSSNQTLVPNANIVFGGSGANRTVTVTPAAGQTGTATITVTVSDGPLNTPTSFLLTVNATNTAPTISAIAAQTTNEDTATSAIPFTVGDAETAAGSLTLSASSSNTTVVPNANVVFGGSGANRTVTLTPAANQFGTATITATVSDGQLSTPTSFLLTVNAVNDAPTITAIANQTTTTGTAVGPISFTVGDVETAVGSLTVGGSSNSTTLVPNTSITFGGSGANRTVTVTPAAGHTGTATITVTVSDGQLSASTLFTLTVNATLPGLVAAYAFNEGSGTTLTDASGNNNHGTISGATWTTAGNYGGALVFNGTSSMVTIPNSPSLQLTTGMTLQAWVNASVVNSNWRDVIYKGNDNYYLDGTSSNSGRPAIGGIIGGGNSNVYGTASLTVNIWIHLAATYDGATLRLYVNGSQVSTTAVTGNIATSTNPLQIGGDSIYGQFFQGMIDEVRIYNRALTQAEIVTDMNTPIGIPVTDTQPPTVTISSPSPGSTASHVTMISASATDDVGVVGVEFFMDGISLGMSFSAPHVLPWDTTTASNATHTLTAVAEDAAGNSVVSAPVLVTTLNPVFVNEVVVPDISVATTIAFLPDGRMLVGELTEKIWVVQPSAIQPDPIPFLQLDNTQLIGEQGLMDIAIDANFTQNGYYYVFYTRGFPGSNNHNRVSRFTANGNGTDPGSELVLWQDNVVAEQEHHGGTVAFGSDGKLYITYGDQFIANSAQQMDSYRGKILRINSDGSVPPDNPFVGQAGVLPEIWAFGLRNPFRMSFDQVTGKMYIGDVGGNDPNTAIEEVNLGAVGANYGWPMCEGNCAVPGTTNPIFSYSHNGRDASITGGIVYRGTQFPSEYNGSFFFADYVQNTIKRLTFDANGNVVSLINFWPSDGSPDGPVVGDPVKLIEGPDGSLYYVDIGFNDQHVPNPAAIKRIRYILNNQPPVVAASVNPTAGVPPLTVSFSSAGSFDPEGVALTYNWSFGDGLSSTDPNPTHTYPTAGLYDARLVISDGVNTTLSADLNITVGNSPTPTILSPVNGNIFRAGDAINYSGNGTDLEDGDLPASAFSWTILFHHDTHVHPAGGPFTNTKTGTLAIPTSGHDFQGSTSYEIILSITDSTGLTSSTSVTVLPDKVNLAFDAIPSGLTLEIDGISKQTPFIADDLIGFQHTINAPNQSSAGTSYTFTSWSDAGGQSHQIQVPTVNQSYVATFSALDTTPPDTAITASPTNPSNSSNASFSFTSTETGSSFQCQLDSAGFAACASPQNYTNLSSSSHTFEVRAIDAAGNVDSSPASYTWTVDTVTPDSTITATPPNPSNSSSASFSFTSNEPGSFQCQLDDAGFTACTSPQNYANLTSDSHTFEVRAIDAANNTDPTPASYTWTVDTVAPETNITATPPNPSNSNSASFSFTSSETGSFQCQLDGTGFAACVSPKSYTALAPGSHTFQVRAIDLAGNVDPTPASYTWNYQPITAFPIATTIETGSLQGGTATSLNADDNNYYRVNSTTSGTLTTSWYGSFGAVPATLSNLKITYKGKNSRNSAQTISIWRWTDNSWVQLDSRNVGTNEVQIANLTPAGTLSGYVSPTGELRIRIRNTRNSGTFVTSGDLMQSVYDIP